MSYMNVKFFDKDYSIPEDVLAYVDLVDFTNEIRDYLNASFVRQIRPGIDAIESDNFMIAAFNDQVSIVFERVHGGCVLLCGLR